MHLQSKTTYFRARKAQLPAVPAFRATNYRPLKRRGRKNIHKREVALLFLTGTAPCWAGEPAPALCTNHSHPHGHCSAVCTQSLQVKVMAALTAPATTCHVTAGGNWIRTAGIPLQSGQSQPRRCLTPFVIFLSNAIGTTVQCVE
jgi:hypothetical protein